MGRCPLFCEDKALQRILSSSSSARGDGRRREAATRSDMRHTQSFVTSFSTPLGAGGRGFIGWGVTGRYARRTRSGDGPDQPTWHGLAVVHRRNIGLIEIAAGTCRRWTLSVINECHARVRYLILLPSRRPLHRPPPSPRRLSRRRRLPFLPPFFSHVRAVLAPLHFWPLV